VLTFGIGPFHTDEEGAELRDRAARTLSEALGQPVSIVSYDSYASLETAVLQGRADLSWLSPAIFARTADSQAVELAAAISRGKGQSYRGVLFVKRDARANSVLDLQGAKVAWVDRDSCAGYLYPKLALDQRSVPPSRLFSSQTFLGSHVAVVRAVMRGDVDAGATYAQLAEGTERIHVAAWAAWTGADSMRAMLVSDPIPSDVIATRRGLAGASTMKAKLLSLHERPGAGALLDELLGGPRLLDASASDYDAVRNALRGR
jgi:phosphonate transport system substrate-binding protein